MRERSNATDRTISRSIRLHRLARGMTQAELGAALGITFQQVQKYESGRNRVSSGRLLRIAHILKVDVRSLLGGTNGAENVPSDESSPVDLIAEPQSLRLATIFASIEDADLRRAVIAIAARLASVSQRTGKRR
jgi:transcriptional regulator with XRE-family HTH domain